MVKKSNKSGWTLCPSKSYPGKFYYFNVLNGDAAWCLNEDEKKFLRKQDTIQKLKVNHLYPNPITPPDHRSSRASNYHSTIRTSVPTFGQATFTKYISNDKEIMGKIDSPSQILQQVTNSKIMLNQNGVSPLFKRFKNKTNENCDLINYEASTKPKDWWNSTNVWSNVGKHSDPTDRPYKRKIATKPILKESKLNKLQYSNKNDIYNKPVKQISTLSHSNNVENPNQNKKMLTNLDTSDLRYVLRAKRRKPDEMQDFYNTEHSTFNNKKKVTFNIKDNNNNTFHPEEKNIGETAYKNNESQQTSGCYLVVDLDVLLEDYGFIKTYVNKDEYCHLHVPSVIQDQLKKIAKGEHGGRSCVIVARQLLRHLESLMPRLNLSENKEDTETHQIINCCLEIIKQNYDVVLVTKEIELIHAAELHKIKAYHINDLKSNELEHNTFNVTKIYNKPNLFLQNMGDFDPFTLSKTIEATGYCRQNISSNNNSEVNNSDISDINTKISKLNINDKILNNKGKVQNNYFANKIVKTNDNINSNFETCHNINETVERNSNEIKNGIYNKKKNNEVNEYSNMNLLTKPLNEERSTNIFEEKSKTFNITNSIMENNLYLRFEEWVCTYEQILEEFLYIILQKNTQHVNQPPPLLLHEGMECLKEIYRDNNYIINSIEKFLYYYDFSYENGTNIKPYNFMTLFGCGFYLVEALKETSPYISDIQEKLIYMRDMLECPIEDLVAGVPNPTCYDIEDRHAYKCNYVKNPSDVLDYLKKHFSEWKNYYEAQDNTNQIEQEVNNDNITVLRTFGRDLDKFTINNSKCLNFTKETDKQTGKLEFQSNYPKVTHNIKLLDTIDEQIKKNKNEFSNLETTETISSTSFKSIISDKEINDLAIVAVNNDTQNNDISINDVNDSTKESGLESNSLSAYSLVRIFLSELSSSFKIIHTFIDESIKDYKKDIDEEKKRNLYEKANKTHIHITEIIDKLKIIIQRESTENSTLKSLLIKTGTDNRTARYRPVVMKCLEQAKILEQSLELILSITNDDALSEVSSEKYLHLVEI